jgi:hypothetical protein
VGPRVLEIRTEDDSVEVHMDARAGSEGTFRIYLPRQPSRCRGATLYYEGGGIYRADVDPPQGESGEWARHVVEIDL